MVLFVAPALVGDVKLLSIIVLLATAVALLDVLVVRGSMVGIKFGKEVMNIEGWACWSTIAALDKFVGCRRSILVCPLTFQKFRAMTVPLRWQKGIRMLPSRYEHCTVSWWCPSHSLQPHHNNVRSMSQGQSSWLFWHGYMTARLIEVDDWDLDRCSAATAGVNMCPE